MTDMHSDNLTGELFTQRIGTRTVDVLVEHETAEHHVLQDLPVGRLDLHRLFKGVVCFAVLLQSVVHGSQVDEGLR